MRRLVAACLLASLAAVGCGGGSQATAPVAIHWQRALHVPGIVDASSPRPDGRRIVAAASRLWLLDTHLTLTPFARGQRGYQTAPKTDEPYLTLAGGCFGRGVYVLAPGAHPAVLRVDAAGRTSRFARLAGGLFPDGIAFDATGRFGHPLLVTATKGSGATVLSIDCRGAVHTVARRIPRVEGGIAVAPASFGRFGGDLIAPNENTGLLYAIDPRGSAQVLARSGLPKGGDIGVESAGFVPSTRSAAYVADRGTPGNPHPGTDSLLALPAATLAGAGVHAGDLIVVTEGGGRTIDVSCAARCSVRHFADGPAVAHVEGHVVFAR